MTAQQSLAEDLPLDADSRPSLFSSDWRKLLRVSERQEVDGLMHSVRQQARPLEKLVEATQRLPEEAHTWESVEALLNEEPLLQEVSKQEKSLLKRAFVQALKNQETTLPEEVLESLDFELPIPPDTDDYLAKTSHLIASKLAGLLNRERFMHDVFQVGDLQHEKQVMAKHFMLTLEENKKLRRALAESQTELANFQPAGLGLFKKKHP
jgi:hypothetical protein